MRVMGRRASGRIVAAGALVTLLFSMAAPAPASAQTDIVLSPASASARSGGWSVVSDATAAGGQALHHPNANAPKRTSALASPTHYFELTFSATAGIPYRLWLHGKAQNNHWGNDSVFVQFAGSVTASGAPTYRIGTTSATDINLEECSGCGLSGWQWQDNGWGSGVLGPVIYFATTGTQTMRVQTREDGLFIDRIVLSPTTYLTAAPAGLEEPRLSVSPEIVLNPSVPTRMAGQWSVVSDSTAVGGLAIRHPNANAAKLTAPLANPIHYFELTFDAAAGVPYRLWLHGKADNDYWGNDSVFVQFSGSVTATGAAVFRTGTTSAAEVNLEECSGCGLRGWQWQDNGWGSGVLGPVIYFATTGTQTMRIQTREDGISLDQIVLSSSLYLTSAPTTPGTSSSSTSSAPPPPPPPPPPSTSDALLKVLDWNIHHGVGTDGVYDINRIADWIVRTGANVVSLNEVEKYTGWGNEDQPARFATLLRSKTGTTWYFNFAHRTGGTNGQGNLLLSTYPIESEDDYELSYSRSVARIAIIVNGIRVNVFSTHLDADSSARRQVQMQELIAWSATFPEQRILAGDYNAWPGASEISTMTAGYYDAWAVAVANGVEVAYAGNTAGNTRNSRIDYVFYSKAASRLRLTEARVFDTRDANGVMPSDHRPLMATFEVR